MDTERTLSRRIEQLVPDNRALLRESKSVEYRALWRIFSKEPCILQIYIPTKEVY